MKNDWIGSDGFFIKLTARGHIRLKGVDGVYWDVYYNPLEIDARLSATTEEAAKLEAVEVVKKELQEIIDSL